MCKTIFFLPNSLSQFLVSTEVKSSFCVSDLLELESVSCPPDHPLLCLKTTDEPVDGEEEEVMVAFQMLAGWEGALF